MIGVNKLIFLGQKIYEMTGSSNPNDYSSFLSFSTVDGCDASEYGVFRAITDFHLSFLYDS